jgi:hypothetical protein
MELGALASMRGAPSTHQANKDLDALASAYGSSKVGSMVIKSFF